MKIYFNTLTSGDKVKALYLKSDIGTFYAEPVNDGVIGEGLLFNDLMFHFEGNEDRTVIKLKDSENYIKDAINGWLSLHKDIHLITNNQISLDMLSSITQSSLDDHHQTVVGLDDENLPVIEKTEKLKQTYDAKG